MATVRKTPTSRGKAPKKEVAPKKTTAPRSRRQTEEQPEEEVKRKYVGLMSCWCNEDWDDIQRDRNLEHADAGMTVSVRPTEAKIFIEELERGIEEDRPTQLYLMDNRFKRDGKKDPDFNISIMMNPEDAEEVYAQLKASRSGGGNSRRRR